MNEMIHFSVSQGLSDKNIVGFIVFVAFYVVLLDWLYNG